MNPSGEFRDAHRRAVDIELVDTVRTTGKESREYRTLANTLADLLIGTLTNLYRRGELFGAVAEQCRIPLPSPPADYRHHVYELIYHAVGEALPSFLEDWVLGGRWDPSRGALTSCAVRAALYAFVAEYRTYLRVRLAEPELVGPEVLDALAGDRSGASSPALPDPEATTVDRDRIQRLLADAGPRVEQIVHMKAQGFTHREIGRALGMHPEAVSSALRRFRSHTS